MPRSLHGGPHCRRGMSEHGRGGAAIIEFAMCIPVLAMVVALTFFFGWGMVNQQQVWVAGRYACWRQVRAGSAATGDELNIDFCAGRASTFTASRDGGTTRAEQDFVDDVAAESAVAGDLAKGLVIDRYPKGLGVDCSGDFPTSNRVWRQFAGSIHGRSARIGVEWRWRQAQCCQEVTDQFLPVLENMLTQMPAPADGMGAFFRTLYRDDWVFRDY
jgi:hypothetical protein